MMGEREAKGMTRVSNEPNRAAYEVGYGRPPMHTRFQKGRSGNPGGRMARAGDLDALILAEARRPVTVREGERVVQMPMIQAVLRSQASLAIKGNERAQQAVLSNVQRVEDGMRALHEELLRTALEYREVARHEQARKARLGIGPHPNEPHPDDVSIDLRTGDVHVRHPDFSVPAEFGPAGLGGSDEDPSYEAAPDEEG